jgi:hypothetical protein
LTQSFNPGRISHYPGMSMEKQKQKQGHPDFIVAVRIDRSRRPAMMAAPSHPIHE